MTARTPLVLSAAALACFAAAGLSLPAPAGSLTAAEADGCVGGKLRGYCVKVRPECNRTPNVPNSCFGNATTCGGNVEASSGAIYECESTGTSGTNATRSRFTRVCKI